MTRSGMNDEYLTPLPEGSRLIVTHPDGTEVVYIAGKPVLSENPYVIRQSFTVPTTPYEVTP